MIVISLIYASMYFFLLAMALELLVLVLLNINEERAFTFRLCVKLRNQLLKTQLGDWLRKLYK